MRPLLLASALWTRDLAGHPLVVVDGGSRGELFAPLNQVPAERLRVARYEPDPNADARVRPGDLSFGQGLWSAPATLQLHVAQEPSTSSVYPPDERLLRQFVDRIGWPPRRTTAVLPVPGTSIDASFAEAGLPGPDFIKLDIHSAEYEALEGAAQALQTTAVAVLVEAWPAPIHRGQRTAAEVEVLLNKAGFFLFEHQQAIAWPRQGGAGTSKAQLVCLEGLYFRDLIGTPELATWPATRLLKAVALADLYGHIDYALQLLAAGRNAGTLSDTITTDWQDFLRRANPPRLVRRYLEKLHSWLTQRLRAY